MTAGFVISSVERARFPQSMILHLGPRVTMRHCQYATPEPILFKEIPGGSRFWTTVMMINEIHKLRRAIARMAVLAGALLTPGLSNAGAEQENPPVMVGPYVISVRLFCASPAIGAGNFLKGHGALPPPFSASAAFLSLQAKFIPATSATYAYWLSSMDIPDPTDRTTYAQLGFGQANQYIIESVIEWGNIDIFGLGTSTTSAANPEYSAVPAAGYGTTQFIVTRYWIPTMPHGFSMGYLFYIWSRPSPLIPLNSAHSETFTRPAGTGPLSSLNPLPNTWQQQVMVFTHEAQSRAKFSASGAYRTVLLSAPNGIIPGGPAPPSCAAIQQWDGVASE